MVLFTYKCKDTEICDTMMLIWVKYYITYDKFEMQRDMSNAGKENINLYTHTHVVLCNEAWGNEPSLLETQFPFKHTLRWIQ